MVILVEFAIIMTPPETPALLFANLLLIMVIFEKFFMTVTPAEKSALLLANSLLIMMMVVELIEAITPPVLFQNLQSLITMVHCSTTSRTPPKLLEAMLW